MSSTQVSEERSSSQGKKKWGASSLLFRNSGDGSGYAPSRKSSEGDDGEADAAIPAIATYEDVNDEIWHDDGDGEDDDPLLSLFRVHNTNRVRFDLTPSSSTDDGAPPPSAAAAASFVDDNDKNIMNYCSEQSYNSKKSLNQSDKFKKLFIRTNHSSSRGNSGVGATPPPILLKKASSNLKHSSVNGSLHGGSNGSGGTVAGKNILGLSRNDNDLGYGDDDPDDAYIKKMLEPTPIRRISSFLTSGNSFIGFSGDNSSGKKTATSSVVSPREDGIKQSSKLSGTNYNDDNNSEINFATIKSSLSVRGNPPNCIDGGSNSSCDNNFTNNRRRFRRRHHSLFRPTKCNDTNIAALLKKARSAHKHSFRYQLAMRYYLLALKEITSSSSSSGYSDTTADDPLTAHILKSLNDVHHAQVTLSNSSNIVQMGIQHEDANQLVKALRMYTIAYRMRRDALGVNHPSLAVLLNMMGGVQMKRLDYDEAMRLYELSLNGRQDENGGRGRNILEFRNRNPLTTRYGYSNLGSSMLIFHKLIFSTTYILHHKPS